MKRLFKTIWMALAISAAGLSHALISPPVGVTVNSAGVILGDGARGTLAWSVNLVRVIAGPGPTPTVSSSQLVVKTLSGTVIDTQSRLISQPFSAAGTLVLSESFSLSAAVAYRAYCLGSPGVVLERSFVDSTNPSVTVTASTTLPLSSAPGSGLLVARVDLRFDRAGLSTQVNQGDPLRAIATLRTEGNGWLDARWEIADGSGLQGDPLWRPLRAFRQFVGGGQAIELQSPPLPTQRSGRTLVRLSVREPVGTAEATPLLYQVLGPASDETVGLMQPAEGAFAGLDTRFAWTEIPGARAYLVELMLDPQEPGAAVPPERESAALVSAPDTAFDISALMRQSLQAGKRYQWRVLAMDEQGRVIARSAPRRLQVP